MKHYEVMLLMHPEHSSRVENLLQHFKGIVEKGGGLIHRLENLGKRNLAYEIDSHKKAYYALMNIEVSPSVLAELEEQFRYNETVLRKLVIKMRCAVKSPSILANNDESNSRR